MKGFELHGRLVKEMIVGVTIEDKLLRRSVTGGKRSIGGAQGEVDEDSVLLEEVGCLQAPSLCELAIIRAGRVEIGSCLGSLLESSKDDDLVSGDLEGTHVKEAFWKAKLEQLPAVLTFR